MRVLLHSGGPLGPDGRREILGFLGGRRRVAFVTAASLHDETAYFARVQSLLGVPPPEGAGLELLHLRWNDRPLDTLGRAEALFMGGGNTYALLKRLREAGLLTAIRARVEAGMPYVGASAGSNVAGPTILTTNDWNVVALDRFDALGLVRFNINPHYKETDPAMAPGSETRDDRIREYHVVNANPVVGLEEGALARVEAESSRRGARRGSRSSGEGRSRPGTSPASGCRSRREARGYSARIVVRVMFWAPSVPVARSTRTITCIVASRLGGTVGPVGVMDQVRVMPGSGVSVPLVGPGTNGWFFSCSIICRAKAVALDWLPPATTLNEPWASMLSSATSDTARKVTASITSMRVMPD